jgi:hypothetical protein
MAKWRPDDPNHPFVERGYNPKFAISIRDLQPKDPWGEEAYQKELLVSAERNRLRVPDPSLYHNSPSAIAFVKRREQDIFRPRNQPRSDSQPNTPSSTRTSSYSPNQLPEPNLNSRQGFPSQLVDARSEFDTIPRLRDLSPTSRIQQNGAYHPMSMPDPRHRHHSSHEQPMTLEPSGAPSGPSRMLR